MKTKSPTLCFHLSHLFSYLSALSGVAAVYFAIDKNLPGVGLGMAFSSLADLLNSHFARLIEKWSGRPKDQKGDQLASQFNILMGGVVFGLVPIVCILALTAQSEETNRSWTSVSLVLQGTQWFSAGFYLLCTLTRLASSAVFLSEEGGSLIGTSTTFVGLVWASAFLFQPVLVFAWLIFFALGFLMVSPIRIKKPRGWIMAGYILWGLAAMGLHLFALN